MLQYSELREPTELDVAVVKHWLISMVNSKWSILSVFSQNKQTKIFRYLYIKGQSQKIGLDS